MSIHCRFTKPGGWIEFMEYSMSFYTQGGEYKDGCATDRWCTEVRGVLDSLGLEPNAGPKLLNLVTDAGFTNINQEKFYLPVGTWPKDKKLVSRSIDVYGRHANSKRRKRSVW